MDYPWGSLLTSTPEFITSLIKTTSDMEDILTLPAGMHLRTAKAYSPNDFAAWMYRDGRDLIIVKLALDLCLYSLHVANG